MFGLRVAQRGIVGSSRLLGASGRNRQWSRIPVARALSTSDTSSEEHSFQAETRQLLDIVTNSLYTDKEVYQILGMWSKIMGSSCFWLSLLGFLTRTHQQRI